MPVYALGNKHPTIHPTAWVHPTAVLIGDVRLGEEVSVWPGAVIRADNSPITIGARTSIQDGSILHTQAENPTTVGEDCVIGHLVHLEGCTIEDCVLVGSSAVVLEQVICRRGSLIGAKAMVTAGTEIPSGALAVGVPAKVKLDKVKIERITMNAEGYVEHLIDYRNNMREITLASCLSDTTKL
jgi:carbonic anhydrase/acetyltransferase-like protein (isoleucine patch superfamily)